MNCKILQLFSCILLMSLPLFLHFSTPVRYLVPVATSCFWCPHFLTGTHSVELDCGDVETHMSLPPLTKSSCLAFADFLILFIFAPFFSSLSTFLLVSFLLLLDSCHSDKKAGCRYDLLPAHPVFHPAGHCLCL